MAPSKDWRSSLTASERYDNIQKLSVALAAAGGSKNAIWVENEAYTTCASRNEYDKIFEGAQPGNAPPSRPDERDEGKADASANPGVRIGSFHNCYHIASGLTSKVYRSRDRALKVIVETRNMEPHNPIRESRILAVLQPPCVPLLDVFRDHEQRLVLAFPYMPLTLDSLIDQGAALPILLVRTVFVALFRALGQIHAQDIIHRDVKPSAVLLTSAAGDGPIYLSDFGTAWHPTLSAASERRDAKILDIGTGPYRAPDALFGNSAYGPPVDMWAAGCVLAECLRRPGPKALFDSPPTHEDGSQLGLILSIFKTIGSPTGESWPEAKGFKTPPFEIYRQFERREWHDVLPEVDEEWLDLVGGLLRYGGRMTAEEALRHVCLCR